MDGVIPSIPSILSILFIDPPASVLVYQTFLLRTHLQSWKQDHPNITPIIKEQRPSKSRWPRNPDVPHDVAVSHKAARNRRASSKVLLFVKKLRVMLQ
jgi:hypothetical protein